MLVLDLVLPLPLLLVLILQLLLQGASRLRASCEDTDSRVAHNVTGVGDSRNYSHVLPNIRQSSRFRVRRGDGGEIKTEKVGKERLEGTTGSKWLPGAQTVCLARLRRQEKRRKGTRQRERVGERAGEREKRKAELS